MLFGHADPLPGAIEATYRLTANHIQRRDNPAVDSRSLAARRLILQDNSPGLG